MKVQSDLGRFLRNISPTVWPLIIACCLVLLGLGLPYATLLLKLGIFIIGIYAVIWILWIIFQAKSW